jgi:hypothetical protein
MDHSKAQQNFDSRTLALLNRLASRRQNMPSTPGARPESGKGDAGSAAGGGKVQQVGLGRGAAVSPAMLRGPPVDLSGKGSVNQVQRPTSAARIEHIRLQGKQGPLVQAASGGTANGGMNIQVAVRVRRRAACGARFAQWARGPGRQGLTHMLTTLDVCISRAGSSTYK